MAKNQIGSEEQLKIRNKAKAELERLEQIDMKKVNDYKEKFAICEIVYKTVLEEYFRISEQIYGRNETAYSTSKCGAQICWI